MKKFSIIFFLVIYVFSIAFQGTFAVWVNATQLKQKAQERQQKLKLEKENRLLIAKAKKEALLKPHFWNWTFIIWKDIQPWIYRTRLPSKGCYFTRVSGFGWTFEEIIANGLTNFVAIVSIDSKDKGFISKNCGTWTQDLTQITKDKTTFSDWMFIVWTDIEAWTYKNSGWKWCYYVRLSDFSWNFDDIISNEITNDSAIVTIDSSDKWFSSHGCGTWKKIN